MLRLILIFILFYFIYRGIKLFVRYFTAEFKKQPDIRGNTSTESKYKDVEEVEFREIKTDSKDNSE